MCVCSRLTENSGEAKVTQFDDLMFGDEDVFWFDVSVDALNKHTDKMSANSRGQRSPSWFPASCRTYIGIKLSIVLYVLDIYIQV